MAISADKVKSIADKIIKKTASKYKEEVHIPMLIEHFGAGGDLCHFLADAEITNFTFYNWLEVHPKMKQAYAIAKELAYVHWLSLVPEQLQEKEGEKFNFNVWRTIMRNRFGTTEHRKISIPELKKCKTPEERIQCIMNCISDGELTSQEAVGLSNVVMASLRTDEYTNLVERLEAAENLLREAVDVD